MSLRTDNLGWADRSRRDIGELYLELVTAAERRALGPTGSVKDSGR